jgi:hypothetical protein
MQDIKLVIKTLGAKSSMFSRLYGLFAIEVFCATTTAVMAQKKIYGGGGDT